MTSDGAGPFMKLWGEGYERDEWCGRIGMVSILTMSSTPCLLRSKTPLSLEQGKINYGGGCVTLQSFTSVDLSNYTFSHVNFYSCDFRECIMNQAVFLDCTFTHCDLRSVNVFKAKFIGCTFLSSVAHGTDWSKAQVISGSTTLDCNLSSDTDPAWYGMIVEW